MPKNTYSQSINRRYEMIFGLFMGIVLIVLAMLKNYFDSDQPGPVRLADTASVKQAVPDPVSPVAGESPQLTSKRTLIESVDRFKPVDRTAANEISINKQQLHRWIAQDQYSKARHYLMQLASEAVDQKDDSLLAAIMHLLAQVSATQGDLASAEVYLYEALDIFEQLNNADKIADTQLLIGQMYAKRRQIAQMAGWAYGDLLMARFFLSKGSYQNARQTLESSIAKNLELGRTGAVASAYKTMARYYRNVNDISGEQLALIESGKYYAHSGQSRQAKQILLQLHQRQASLELLDSLEVEIEKRLSQYKSQINLVRQARDYMQLYSLYKSKGELGRAWRFRVKASEILSRTEKRDMFFRAPDVMALLYDSNFNITRAENYYKRAIDHYLSENNLPAYNKALLLQSELN